MKISINSLNSYVFRGKNIKKSEKFKKFRKISGFALMVSINIIYNIEWVKK